jgi:hypothetical protein
MCSLSLNFSQLLHNKDKSGPSTTTRASKYASVARNFTRPIIYTFITYNGAGERAAENVHVALSVEPIV